MSAFNMSYPQRSEKPFLIESVLVVHYNTIQCFFPLYLDCWCLAGKLRGFFAPHFHSMYIDPLYRWMRLDAAHMARVLKGLWFCPSPASHSWWTSTKKKTKMRCASNRNNSRKAVWVGAGTRSCFGQIHFLVILVHLASVMNKTVFTESLLL